MLLRRHYKVEPMQEPTQEPKVALKGKGSKSSKKVKDKETTKVRPL